MDVGRREDLKSADEARRLRARVLDRHHDRHLVAHHRRRARRVLWSHLARRLRQHAVARDHHDGHEEPALIQQQAHHQHSERWQQQARGRRRTHIRLDALVAHRAFWAIPAQGRLDKVKPLGATRSVHLSQRRRVAHCRPSRVKSTCERWRSRRQRSAT